MTSVRAAALLLAAACAAPRPLDAPALLSHGSATPSLPCGPYGDDAPAERTLLEARAWSELPKALRGADARLQPSGALDRAARALAAAAARAVPDPLARDRVQGALRLAGAFDPAPVAHLASGPADGALAALLARVERNGATHAGIGDHVEGGVHHVVLLLSRRKARLERFPGAVEPGPDGSLRGELVGLHHPRAYVTRPDGVAEEVPLQGGRAFTARLRFPIPGRYTVEVLGSGERGPEVAAILGVSVGGARCEGNPPPRRLAAEPDDPGAAEAAVVEAANRTRRSHGLPGLAPSVEIARVARRHSERMLAARAVAHVLPGDGELADRLGAERIPFRRAWENVASGGSALDAHAATEASPAHRANLLAPSASAIGVGVAHGALPTGERVAYLTEILVEPPGDLASDRLTPDARVREALWRERARRALPPLTNDPGLEALARRAATSMRAADSGEVPGLTEGALKAGRELAAADSFIASSPDEAVRSRNLSDARFRRVGVGVVVGESRRFGPGRLFIAVVYSD